MLSTIEIQCPRCGDVTPVAVSAGGSEPGGAASSTCRRCGVQLISLTREDGSFLVAAPDPSGSVDDTAATLVRSPEQRPGTTYAVRLATRFDVLGDRTRPTHAGVSDEDLGENVVSLSDMLFRPDGSRRDAQEAARHFGWRGVWVAQLNLALEEQLTMPPALSLPPTVFLSYRWGTDDQNAWLSSLGQELAHRGYSVILDRDTPPEDVDVPVFVARIAECRYFLAIIDAGYIERLETPDRSSIADGWVFDEVNVARHLSNADRIRIIGLIREDVQLPSGFRLSEPGELGNSVIVRTAEQLRGFLDDAFPPLADRPPEAAVTAARSALIASEQALARGDAEVAREAAHVAISALANTPDGYAQLLRVAFHTGETAVGLAASREMLRLLPDSGEALRAAAALSYQAGAPIDTIGYVIRLLNSATATDHERAFGRYLLGTALDDVGQPYAGRAHLGTAAGLLPDYVDIRTDLGFVCRKLGWLDEALEHFTAGLRLQPDDANLLKNQAATALQLARADVAVEAVASLGSYHPDDPDYPQLAEWANALAAEPQSVSPSTASAGDFRTVDRLRTLSGSRTAVVPGLRSVRRMRELPRRRADLSLLQQRRPDLSDTHPIRNAGAVSVLPAGIARPP